MLQIFGVIYSFCNFGDRQSRSFRDCGNVLVFGFYLVHARAITAFESDLAEFRFAAESFALQTVAVYLRHPDADCRRVFENKSRKLLGVFQSAKADKHYAGAVFLHLYVDERAVESAFFHEFFAGVTQCFARHIVNVADLSLIHI